MINNDVIRRIRNTFNYSDAQVQAIFALAEHQVSAEQVASWLENNNKPGYAFCPDLDLAAFLNGLINEKRGKKDGPQPAPEEELNPNIIFRKLKIAFNLHAEDVLEILENEGLELTKRELSAFFRNPDHKHYKKCHEAICWAFVKGLKAKFGEESE